MYNIKKILKNINFYFKLQDLYLKKLRWIKKNDIERDEFCPFHEWQRFKFNKCSHCSFEIKEMYERQKYFEEYNVDLPDLYWAKNVYEGFDNTNQAEIYLKSCAEVESLKI